MIARAQAHVRSEPPGSRYAYVMDEVALDQDGRVTIPRRFLRELGIDGECVLEVRSADGAIVLRPVLAAPIEIYDDERIAEFLAEDELPEDLALRD